MKVIVIQRKDILKGLIFYKEQYSKKQLASLVLHQYLFAFGFMTHIHFFYLDIF